MFQLWGLMGALAIPVNRQRIACWELWVCVHVEAGEVLGTQASWEEDRHSWRKEEGVWPPTLGQL